MKPSYSTGYGAFMIFLSAVLFSLNILIVKVLRIETAIPVVEITFARFLLGLIIVIFILIAAPVKFRPKNKKILYLRGVLNASAVLILFYAVEYTTLTNANVLNMTYPLFIALFSRPLIGERFHPAIFVPLLLSLAGVFMVIQPRFDTVNAGDLIGLVSGIVSALAIIYLRELRRTDDTFVILFYLFAVGSLMLLIPTLTLFVMPDWRETFLLLLCSATGVAAQYFLTHGYRYVSAVGGSIVSASRVYIASILGIIFFREPVNTVLFAGTLLIVGSNILTARIESANGIK